jgi:hypothetical protein
MQEQPMTDAQSPWSGAGGVDEFEAVDAGTFRSEVQARNRPAVLRGQVADWPLVRAGFESNEVLVGRLRALDSGKPIDSYYGAPEIEGRIFYSEDLRGFNFERRSLGLGAFVEQLLQHRDDATPPALYAGAVRIHEVVPGLLKEHDHGLLDTGTEQLASMWIGNRVRTAAHFDLPQNLACVVAGRRRFTLFPVEQLPNLYVGPLDFTIAGQAISLVDFHRPDFERFPRFREAMRHAQVVELGPGDVLYLPSLWWHHVETLDPFGLMVNFWWRDAPDYMFTPMMTLMHAMLSIRELPENERRAWRAVFDHYAFQLDGDPAAHIPEPARGVLGEMSSDRVRALRQYLGKSLLGIR